MRSIGLDALVAAQLASFAAAPVDEKTLPIDPAAIATHYHPGDMKAAWQNDLADEVARATSRSSCASSSCRGPPWTRRK